jgi:hypothetical protein
MLKNLANAVLFQIGWFACVLGGNSLWLLVTLAVVLLHLSFIGSWQRDGRLMMMAFALGTVLDSALLKLGVFDFSTTGLVIPLWMALLWPLLASTLNHCLAWTAKPLWLASLLGAVSGPASYVAGSHLADVQLPLGLWPSLLILGAIWAVMFPALHWLAGYLRNSPDRQLST